MTRRTVSRAIAAGATLVAAPVLGLAVAQPGQAVETQGSNVTVSKGAYEAVFHHTGSKGETLEVFDHATDGDAAVAYVHIRALRDPKPPVLIDKDRLITTNGYHRFNLREGDSGEYDIPEGRLVSVKICQGYASNPGDNCSGWKTGQA